MKERTFTMDRDQHQWAYGHPWGHEFSPWPGMLLSTLSTLFWIALAIGLTWVLLRWIIPYLMPMIADIFGMTPPGPSALEILRQRYAAGEINADKFEQMRERLEASYPHSEPGPPS